MVETADVVVAGLGAVGSAALHRLAMTGARVVGIDRFHPPHDHGSSHGESRITRLAVGEGPEYAPLVRRSHAIWRELEAQSGESLFLQTGGLVMGPGEGAPSHHGKPDFVRRTIAVAQDYGIPHDVLNAEEIGRRFPQLGLAGDELACFEPSAGLVFPERCIAVQLRLAQQAGATVHCGETVVSIADTASGVAVTTGQRVIHAARAILTAGPWLPELAGGPLREVALAYRQVLHWFTPQDPADYAPERFPVFIWMHGVTDTDYFYGFPVLPGSAALKVATEQYADPVAPDTVDRTVGADESAAMFDRHVAGRLRGIRPECRRAAVCLYTVTPDNGFIVDTMPGRPNVLVASACSGHGFKHSAALGELLAARATATEPAAASAFDLARFAMASALG